MPRAVIAMQVFLLMCAPLPQASYVAVGLGRDAGLTLALMLALYALSDAIVVTAIALAVRRLPLPDRLRRLAERMARRSERAAGGRALLPAFFAIGAGSLYSAGVLAGVSRVRLLPALSAGVAGDVLQFAGAVALGGALARMLPVPHADWVFLLVAPLLVAAVPAAGWAIRAAARALVAPPRCSLCAAA